MNRKISKMFMSAGALLLLGICWGCGTGAYESRLDERISKLKSGSKFNLLSSPVNVPGTSVSVRLPQAFRNTPLKAGSIVEGKKVDSKRLNLNVVDLSDLKATYEGFIEDSKEGKQPYYLYIAVSMNPNRANFPKGMQAELNQKFPDTPELSDLKALTPEGRSIKWQRCRGTGNQEFFYVPKNGDGKFQSMNGAVDLLFLDENGVLVTLAWRMPTAIEQSIDAENLINMVAGCVKISPNAAAGGE